MAKPWRGIVPFKSTRLDVERVLGKPNGYGHYDFEDEQIYIHYLEKPCQKVKDCWCMVAPGTVLNIYVSYDRNIRLSEFGVDKRKLQKQPKGHLLDHTAYYDPIEGASYNINDQTENVIGVVYLHSKEHCFEILKSYRKSEFRKSGKKNA